MMELKKARRRAASRVPDKGAPPPVARPDGSLHRGGNVTRGIGSLGAGARNAKAAPWPIRRRQSGSFELCEEHSQGPIDDRGRIARRDGVAQKVLGTAQLLVCLATHGELNLVAFGCDWGQDSGPVRRCRDRQASLVTAPVRRGISPRRVRRGRNFRSRKSSNRRRHIGPRMELHDQLFDLPLDLVSSGVQKLHMVGVGQMRREQVDRRQGDRSLRQKLEDLGKASGCARRLDASVGGMFGKVQHLGAVREER